MTGLPGNPLCSYHEMPGRLGPGVIGREGKTSLPWTTGRARGGLRRLPGNPLISKREMGVLPEEVVCRSFKSPKAPGNEVIFSLNKTWPARSSGLFETQNGLTAGQSNYFESHGVVCPAVEQFCDSK